MEDLNILATCEHEWNKREAEAAAYSRIRGMKASIGGFHEGKFFVDIDFETRQMKWGHWKGQEEVHYKKLRQSSVDWINMDGTQWEVELIREDRNIIKSGDDNSFPYDWNQFYGVMKRYARKSDYLRRL